MGEGNRTGGEVLGLGQANQSQPRWQKQAGWGVAAVAALGLLIEASCRLAGASFVPLPPSTSERAQVVAQPGLSPAAAVAEPDALTNAFEEAVHRALLEDASAAPAEPAAAPAETSNTAATDAVDAPSAPPAPAAPAPVEATSGWQAPSVARVPFDPEIEQWRPLVRQELARAWSEGRLTGGAAKLDDDVVLALIEQESGGDAEAESWAGAIGLTQVMPFTFADIMYGDESVANTLDLAPVFDPHQNVRAGIRYLAMAMQVFNGNLYWALSSYNAGIGAVQDWRSVGLASVPPIGGYVETANYAPAILSNLAAHRPGLAVNIPAPMTDDEVAEAVTRLQDAGLW